MKRKNLFFIAIILFLIVFNWGLIYITFNFLLTGNYTVHNIKGETLNLFESELKIPVTLSDEIIEATYSESWQDAAVIFMFKIDKENNDEFLSRFRDQYTLRLATTMLDETAKEREKYTIDNITYKLENKYNFEMYTSLYQYKEINDEILYKISYRYPGDKIHTYVKNHSTELPANILKVH